MQPFNLWSVTLLLAAGLGVFISAVLLAYRRPNRLPNQLLAVVFLILSFDLAHLLLLETGLYRQFPHFLATPFPLMLLIGPGIYFYIRALLDEEFRFGTADSVHLAMLLLSTISRLPFYLTNGAAKIEVYAALLSRSPMTLSVRGYIIIFIGTAVLLAYVYGAHRYLKSYRLRNARNDEVKVSWLRKFVLVYIIYSVARLFGTVLLFVFESFTMAIDNTLALVNAAILFTMGYLTLIYPEIYSGLQRRKTTVKYEKSPLSSDYTNTIISKLTQLMKTEKPYLSDDLKLTTLAEMLAISPNHLSQAVNQELRITFNDFVNQYRIAEAQRRLADPASQSYTILGVALEVGFNNKSSFNRAFKKHAGVTPSEFMKVHRNNPTKSV